MIGDFTLDDFRTQILHLGKLEPLKGIMGMIPGSSSVAQEIEGTRRLVGIIDSMTPVERRNPSRAVYSSRGRRIAGGAGVEPQEVDELVRQYDGMANLMKKMKR